MALTFHQLHPCFVAEASGLDLRAPLDNATVTALDAAMTRYAVLVFRAQPLSEEQQVAFASRFGTLDTGLYKVTKPTKRRLKHEVVIDISNVDADNQLLAADSRGLVMQLANQLWHSDSSFQTPPGKYSMLAAHVLPEREGETEWADQRAAYDALAPELKARLEGLIGEHFALHSRLMLGAEYSEEERKIIPPVRWPLVRTHADSGRKTLFIGAHVSHIVGWSVPQSRVFLQFLLEHTTQPQFVYRHQWHVDDFIIWDNRCVLHRGRPYDLSQRRELTRTTTEDLVSAAEFAHLQPAPS